MGGKIFMIKDHNNALIRLLQEHNSNSKPNSHKLVLFESAGDLLGHIQDKGVAPNLIISPFVIPVGHYNGLELAEMLKERLEQLNQEKSIPHVHISIMLITDVASMKENPLIDAVASPTEIDLKPGKNEQFLDQVDNLVNQSLSLEIPH